MQPGEALLTGQVNGQQLGNALFQFLPSMPHESPIPMPRALARVLFPQGFQPFRAAPTMAPPVTLIPPAAPPVAPAPAPPAPTNAILRREPRKRVLERGSFPQWQ
ncbi:hypothetical protein ES703_73486 [subsurface metagenome]